MDNILISQVIPFSFGFSSLERHPRFYLSLIVCSFEFLSLGHHLMFFHILYFFIYFSSLRHHRRFYLSLIICSCGLSSLGHHLRLNLSFFSIGFSSLGQHPMLSLSLFFAHLVSHHWNAILGSKFLIIGTSSLVLSQLFLYIFGF